MNRQELYKKAMARWGYDIQENILIEECCELVQAIIKRRRHGKTKELLEELMDVEIMVEQIKFYYDCMCGQLAKMEQIKTRKLHRLEQRLRD